MEIKIYIRLLRRWLWLILLSGLIATSIGFVTATEETVRYRASVMLSVGNTFENPDVNTSQIFASQQLAQTYAQILRTRELNQTVADSLGLSLLPTGFHSTNIIDGTSLLEIIVTYTDPILSVEIANELAQQLVLAAPQLNSQQQAIIDSANEQIALQLEQVASLRLELNDVNVDLAQTTDAEERRRLTEQRLTLIGQINQATNSIASFTNSIARLQPQVATVTIIDPATPPATPIRSGGSTSIPIIFGVMAMAVSFVGVLAWEYLRDTLNSSDEIVQAVNRPVLGVITQFGIRNDTYNDRLIYNLSPISRTPDEYRTLRTNLLYAAEHEKRVFVVSSASAREGKSLTTANIAISLALAGKRVLLIDADLRRPRQHEAFALDNQLGLTSLLLSKDVENKENVEQVYGEWQKCITPTQVKGLRLITSGFLPSNPTEILGSVMLKEWVDAFLRSANIDVVLFDTPPCLAMSDSTVLAANVGAEVVLVVNAGQTKRTAAVKALERFQQVGVNVVGYVLNNARQADNDYYGYGYSDYYYYRTNESNQ